MKTAFKLSAYTVVLFVAVAMVASSCKKEEIAPTRVHTINYADNNGNSLFTEEYIYDEQYRLSQVEIDDSLVASFTYNDLSVVETNGKNNGVYALNTDGYVINTNYEFSVLTNFFYSTPGYVDSTKQGSVSTYYTWNGENLVSTYGTDTINYTYLTDKFTTIGNEYIGRAYLGKDSKNLVSTATYTSSNTTISYTYEFDAQNRVTKRSNGTLVETYTYY